MNANTQQPRMLKQKDLRRLMKKRLLQKVMDKAATKIQALVRSFLQKKWEEEQRRWEEQEDDEGFGCMCGDWMCPGCGEGPFIPCCRCGRDCRGGDYESWHICSRRCLVRDD